MEYLELGDFQAYLHRNPPLPEKEANEIAFQVTEGLNFMHQNAFAHRDIKPQVRPVIIYALTQQLFRTQIPVLTTFPEYTDTISTSKPLVG
jgi:hypothetical protein